MNGLVVVDASLAVKWLVSEVHSEKAYALARSWAQARTQPVAPYLMPVEVANALHRRVVRKEVALEALSACWTGSLRLGLNSGNLLVFMPGLWRWQISFGRMRPMTHTTWLWRRR